MWFSHGLINFQWWPRWWHSHGGRITQKRFYDVQPDGPCFKLNSTVRSLYGCRVKINGSRSSVQRHKLHAIAMWNIRVILTSESIYGFFFFTILRSANNFDGLPLFFYPTVIYFRTIVTVLLYIFHDSFHILSFPPFSSIFICYPLIVFHYLLFLFDLNIIYIDLVSFHYTYIFVYIFTSNFVRSGNFQQYSSSLILKVAQVRLGTLRQYFRCP